MFSIAFTYSKYSNYNFVNSSATIATWNFDVSADGTNTSSIDLASTYNKDTLVNGKIAPGTKGSFNLSLDATGSDVGVSYNIEIVNHKNHPKNLVYKYDGIETKNFEDLEDRLAGQIYADDSNKVRIITIEWEWPYETFDDEGLVANDKFDTEAGMNSTDYTFDISVTAKQILPQQ